MRTFLATAFLAAGMAAQTPQLPNAKHIPRMQAVPEPDDQISFRLDEREIARYYFSPRLRRPFVYPVIGPSGRTLTRMGHPGDPFMHSHHNSVWISYGTANGVDFWGDHGKNSGRIVHQRTLDIQDGEDRAGVVTQASWTAPAGEVLLNETRETWVICLPNREWMLVLDVSLDAASTEVAFGGAGFGPIGVRVAKNIAVYFGGGRLRNSEGGEGELEIFRKPARWVDYAGQSSTGVIEGLTLMDHPANPKHPSPFHVREDGWMGAMLSTSGPVVIAPGKPLHLRYGLYVHNGLPPAEQLDARWRWFAKLDLHPPYGPPSTASDCLHGSHRRYNIPRTFKNSADCLAFIKTQQ